MRATTGRGSVRLILALLSPVPAAPLQAGAPSSRIATLLASADGASRQAAYKVRSVLEEYEILRALDLQSC